MLQVFQVLSRSPVRGRRTRRCEGQEVRRSPETPGAAWRVSHHARCLRFRFSLSLAVDEEGETHAEGLVCPAVRQFSRKRVLVAFGNSASTGGMCATTEKLFIFNFLRLAERLDLHVQLQHQPGPSVGM